MTLATGDCATCDTPNDTLLGFAGPKAVAEEIKQRVAGFLRVRTACWKCPRTRR